MNAPKSIILKKSNTANKTIDLPDLPTQQLYEKNEIVSQVITQEVSTNQTFFPKSIHLEDLDSAFITWVKNFNFKSEGNLIPVYLFTLQRFSEFMQNWGETDKTKHPSLPIITITKETPGKKGTYLGSFSSTLPSGETFPLYRIPKVVNGKTIFEYIEIPQPTFVDLQYKITFFTNHLRELNKFNESILQEFKKPQNSINVFGHNMELTLDDISENHKKELEERRYYKQIYVVNLKGFLLDEKDFKIKRSLNAIKMNVSESSPKNNEICEYEIINDITCNSCITFNLNKKSSTEFIYKLSYNFEVKYDNQSSIFNNVEYYVNNILKNIPFIINANDVLKVNYTKNITKPVQIKLCGSKF